MINWFSTESHRGYVVAQNVALGGRVTYVGIKDLNTWFEADTPEALKSEIDAALDC